MLLCVYCSEGHSGNGKYYAEKGGEFRDRWQ